MSFMTIIICVPFFNNNSILTHNFTTIFVHISHKWEGVQEVLVPSIRVKRVQGLIWMVEVKFVNKWVQ